MSDKAKPSARPPRSHEAEHFHRRNQELVEQLRRKLNQEAEVEAIKAATGVEDEALLETLTALGVTREAAPVLHLLPLVEVAWADGEIQADERSLLNEAAAHAGVKPGTAASTFFESLLDQRPPTELFEAGLNYVKALLHAMPDDAAQKARTNLSDFAYEVARANGGVFGLFGKVESSEKAILQRIADKLTEGHAGASQALIDKL